MGNKQKGKSVDDSLPTDPTSDIFASKEELSEEADSKEQSEDVNVCGPLAEKLDRLEDRTMERSEDVNVCGPSAEKPDHLEDRTMEPSEDGVISDPVSSVLNSETSEMSTAPESPE